MNIYSDAESITNTFFKYLVELESIIDGQESPLSYIFFKKAWNKVINDSKVGKVSLSVEYIEVLYSELIHDLGEEEMATIGEEKKIKWLKLLDVLDNFNVDNYLGCDADIIVGFYRYKVTKHFQVTLGWLVVNGFRLQEGLFCILPEVELNQRFKQFLIDATCDEFDAESLRGLFGKYEALRKKS